MNYTPEEAAALVARLEAQGARQSAEVKAAVQGDPPARTTRQKGAQRPARAAGEPAADTSTDRTGSELERLFLAILVAHGSDLPAPVTQYGWAEPLRHWRADFAWPHARLAVEVDGGQWAPGGGRHNQDSDREKLNFAVAIFSWRVLRFSGAQLKSDPAACIALLRRALERG